MAEFVVDVKGDTGDLFAEVLGQFSCMLISIGSLEMISLLLYYCLPHFRL